MKVPWIKGLCFLEHLIHAILHGLQTFQWPKTDARCWYMVWDPVIFCYNAHIEKQRVLFMFLRWMFKTKKGLYFFKTLHMLFVHINANIPHADDMHVSCSHRICCGSCTENNETFQFPKDSRNWGVLLENVHVQNETLTRQQNSTESVTCTQPQYLLQTVQQRV